MTQWLFNFVIAKLTPIMLADITYGTFLLFGACCLLMVVYTIFFVPETANVPLESIGVLFEGNIIAGALKDTIPGHSRARTLQHVRDNINENEVFEDDEESSRKPASKHIENTTAKDLAYGMNNGTA